MVIKKLSTVAAFLFNGLTIGKGYLGTLPEIINIGTGQIRSTSNATGYFRISTSADPCDVVLVNAPGYIYSETLKPDSLDVIHIELIPKEN